MLEKPIAKAMSNSNSVLEPALLSQVVKMYALFEIRQEEHDQFQK